jgi:hypothetical protein
MPGQTVWLGESTAWTLSVIASSGLTVLAAATGMIAFNAVFTLAGARSFVLIGERILWKHTVVAVQLF